MGKRRNFYPLLLIVLFLVVFGTRIYFSYQSPHFDPESYYHLRHIEQVMETGFPLYEDPLSYEGRKYYYPPLFYYVMAAGAKMIGLEAAGKILPSLFFSILVFLVYGIAFKTTRNRLYSFLGTFFFTFTPITYVFPINNVSPYSMALPLFFAVIYTMMEMKKNLNIMLILIITLVFTHPSAFLLVLGTLFYIILMKLEGMKVDKMSIEIVMFTMFLVFWTLFILYKNVFLEHGLAAAWLNLPQDLMSAAFPTLNIFQVIYFVGMVPLFLGSMGAVGAVFKDTNKETLLLLGMSASIFILLWLNFLRLRTGILFLSILLAILSAQGMKSRSDYVSRTKFSGTRKYTIYLLVFFFLVSSIAPLYSSAIQESEEAVDTELVEALEWLKNNSPEDSVVIAPLKEGNMVTYFAERKNVMDTNFIMIPDVNQRFRDLNRVYTVRLKSEALRVVTKYDADYILLSKASQNIYEVEELYYSDDRCFTKIYDEETDIYEVICRFEE